MPTDGTNDRHESHKRERSTDIELRLSDRVGDVGRFVGKYADVDLAAGVEAVKERADRDFRS